MSDTAAVALSEGEQRGDGRDAAWAAINTPLAEQELLSFCREDVERLFRINPYLEFRRWERLAEGRYAFSGRNISQQQPFDFEVELDVEETPDGLRVLYRGGLKSETIFQVDASSHGSKLTIHENYPSLDEGEQEQRLGEVDQSLTTWAGDIQKFLILWKRWSWLGPWRWYMRTVWQRMKPSGRRIAYMFWWITLVEIALIVLGAGIYLAEYS
ncbi:MAG: hypothetical protein ABFR19_05700 [Pseudomonadota bacterium]